MEYEGEYLFGRKWNGKGYDENNNIIYELKNGNGIVKEYEYGHSLIYEGEYLNGKRWNGRGKEYGYDDELIFERLLFKWKKMDRKRKGILCL